MAISKAAIVAALRDQLQTDLHTATQSQQETQRGATHEEARPENVKDTRALESTYLARGLAQRVSELRAGLAKLAAMRLRAFEPDEPAGLGALVTVTSAEGIETRYLLAPAGGGATVTLAGVDVKVVTPQSPLGSSLLRRLVGDEVLAKTPQGVRELEVSGVE